MAASLAQEQEAPVQVIRPSRGWVGLDLRDLWRHRELVYFLTWRTILVRYKQTGLGIAWALIQPFLLMIVLTVIFGRLADTPSNGVPFPVFAYAGLLPWLFFANTMSQASASLVGNANLLSKIYFPRLALPLSAVLAGLIDFIVASSLLGGLMFYYGAYPQPIAVVVAPALVLLVVVTSLGVGCWLSALNVSYRDVQYVVPFLTQVWFFATVVYPTSLLSEPWRTVVGLNPMAGVVEGFRWALVSTNRSPGWMPAVSAGVAVLLLASGAFFFRRAERTFADVV